MFVLILVFIIVAASRNVHFPLSAGDYTPGEIAVENLRIQNINRVPREFNLVAAIVEPRTENLQTVIDNFLVVLPPDTHFQIYHGNQNIKTLEKYAPLISSGKMSLWNMGIDNLSIKGYSLLLTSKEFWQTMQSENVLIFQTDAILCGGNQNAINKFKRFDYVGAPIPKPIIVGIKIWFAGKGYYVDHSRIYNGGFSFRKRSACIRVIEKYPWDKLTSEDVWFCVFLPRVGGRIAPITIARDFAYESEHELTKMPFGLHKPRRNLGKLQMMCPNVKKIPTIKAHSDYRNLYML